VARGTTLLPFGTWLVGRDSVRARLRARPDTGNGHSDLELARKRLQAGLCYRCGSEVADGLARVGSILCHDCRDASPLPATR
jgi:hypothetical protein